MVGIVVFVYTVLVNECEMNALTTTTRATGIPKRDVKVYRHVCILCSSSLFSQVLSHIMRLFSFEM